MKPSFLIYEKICIYFITVFWSIFNHTENFQVDISFFFLNLFLAKFTKRNREIFLFQLNTTQEVAQINDILALLVPKFVKDLLIQGPFIFYNVFIIITYLI